MKDLTIEELNQKICMINEERLKMKNANDNILNSLSNEEMLNKNEKLKLDNNTLNIVNEEKHDGTIAVVNRNPATEISEGADGINNLEAVILEGAEVNGASVDVTYAGIVALVYDNLVKVSIKLDAENAVNPATKISEGTDLVALVCNNQVKVTIKLDAGKRKFKTT